MTHPRFRIYEQDGNYVAAIADTLTNFGICERRTPLLVAEAKTSRATSALADIDARAMTCMTADGSAAYRSATGRRVHELW